MTNESPEEDTETGRELCLGPDSAGRIIFWLGVPVSVMFGITLGLLEPLSAGGLALVWTFCVWYAWRSGFKTAIAIDDSELIVVSALREV